MGVVQVPKKIRIVTAPMADPPTPPRRPLPAVVRALGWVSFFTDAATDLIYPLLPAFLKSLGAGGAALGIVEGVAESVGALVKWQAGARSDRFARKKPFVVAGYAIAIPLDAVQLQAEAAKFEAFVHGPEARAVFARLGFILQ